MIITKEEERKKLLLTAILIVSLFYVSAVACTDILAAKQATVDGSVITSHTCDGRYDSRLVVVPAMDHEEELWPQFMSG